MYFSYSALEADLHADFSKVTVFAVDPATSQRIISTPFLPASQIMRSKKTVNNHNFYVSGSANTPISSMPDDGTVSIVSPHLSNAGVLGLQPLGATLKQKLFLTMNIPSGKFTTSLLDPIKYSAGAFVLANGHSILPCD